MVLHVIPGREIGVAVRLRRVSLGALRFVRRRLMVSGPVGQLGRAMMPRRALVMVRGLAVMLCWTV